MAGWEHGAPETYGSLAPPSAMLCTDRCPKTSSKKDLEAIGRWSGNDFSSFHSVNLVTTWNFALRQGASSPLCSKGGCNQGWNLVIQVLRKGRRNREKLGPVSLDFENQEGCSPKDKKQRRQTT
eukprot:TRINITY_DN6527_c0_g1_i2.p1 TRINITY_DN6527_c0_g1~~TRINITY_DN6527_c0_g1_i2.p1  ORF type:complete len:124 (+),score=5.15 TRINITY_DN6527_c0_g1_i2:185-556(+)